MTTTESVDLAAWDLDVPDIDTIVAETGYPPEVHAYTLLDRACQLMIDLPLSEASLCLTVSSLGLRAACQLTHLEYSTVDLPDDYRECILQAADWASKGDPPQGGHEWVLFVMDLTDLAHELRTPRRP